MTTLTRLLVGLAALVSLSSLGVPHSARAAERPPGQGGLEAIGKDGKPIGPCPLKHTDVQAQLSGFVARVTVTQLFENPFNDPIEAVYTFPLSDRGAVDAMSMRTGERIIRAEIKRREEARQIYENARHAGQTAALLDQERPNIFTQSLANLMPGASVEVTIEYVEPLVFHDGTFEFSFPTVVGPRFVPGEPSGRAGTGWAPDTTRVPDASRITPPVTPPGTRAGHDLSIAVDVDAGVTIDDVTSPLHPIDVTRPTLTSAHVSLRNQAELPNRDFVLRYTVAEDDVKSGYLVHRTGTTDGYASFILLPPKRVTRDGAAPKEMIFVIDRSGSQSGLPLQKAKETMLWILDHMNPNDTFQVVDFGSEANQLFSTPQLASPEVRTQARTYVQALEANGGTMMAEAVRKVCAMPADGHRLRVVTFMTDGYIGNDFEVIDLVRQLRGTSRWFLFGTGDAVNRFLLENMAKAGGGEVDYVLLNEPGDTVARHFYERIASPALTDVRLDFQGLDVVDVFPNAPADVWDRRPLVVHARYRTPGQGHVVLRGFRQGKPYRQTLDVTLPETAPEHAAIASMWARAKVDELMTQDLHGLQSGSFSVPLRDEIVSVALAHRLVTQFTSFVAVEDRIVNEGGQQRTVTVPVELPHGVQYEGVFGGGADGAAKRALLASPPPMAGAFARAAQAPGTAIALADRFMGALGGGRGREARSDATSRSSDPSLDLHKLAPELTALVQGTTPARPVPVVGGRVTVKVVLTKVNGTSAKRLERSGLRVTQVTRAYIVGSITVEQLAALAQLPGVDRIVLP